MKMRIYKQDKSAMQSGRGKVGRWVVEPAEAKTGKPMGLMGWSGGGDTKAQLRLYFEEKAQAIAYVTAKVLAYEILPEQNRKIKPKAYADNFKHDRLKPWTH